MTLGGEAGRGHQGTLGPAAWFLHVFFYGPRPTTQVLSLISTKKISAKGLLSQNSIPTAWTNINAAEPAQEENEDMKFGMGLW